MAKRIVLYNHKGGVGKTTSAVNLSTYIADLNKKTLIVDMDPQGNCSANFSYNIYDIKPGNISIVDVLKGTCKTSEAIKHFSDPEAERIKTLKLLPNDNRLNSLLFEMQSKIGANLILDTKLKEVDNDYDYIIIDAPPQKNVFSMNALCASDYVIIPFKPGGYEVMGLRQIFDVIDEVKVSGIGKSPAFLGLLVTMHQKTKAVNANIAELMKQYGDKVYDIIVPLNTAVIQSTTDSLPLIFVDPYCGAASAYSDLAKIIINQIENTKTNEEE